MMARSTVSYLMAVLHCVYHSSHVSAKDVGPEARRKKKVVSRGSVETPKDTHSKQQASTGFWGEGEGGDWPVGLAAV